MNNTPRLHTYKESITIAIIGYGRFGKTLLRLFKEVERKISRSNYSVKDLSKINLKFLVFDPYRSDIPPKYAKNNISQLYQHSPDFVFFCVPINRFENVLKQHIKVIHKQNLWEHTILVDVLSVKMYAAQIFEKTRKKYSKLQAILTHPMFGPDSSKNGFQNLPIVMHNLSTINEKYLLLQKLLRKAGLRIIEMTPKEHDKLAANSQGVTHFIGRILEQFKFKPTPIDTQGAKLLQQIMEQTTNDTFELFKDLQQYNPYTKQMRLKVGKAYHKVFNKLLPNKVNPPYLTIGIQGGEGSFNHMAINSYVEEKGLKHVKIKYLYTTENVLKKLYNGDIDMGIFAVHNAIGGIVWESAKAMARYTFHITDEVKLLITHHLMKRKDVDFSQITQVVAHPQVFKQCTKNMRKYFPSLKQTVLKGKLIDTALAAKALAKGELAKTTAILGPKILAQLYDFEIIRENLQDLKSNYTYFWIVKRE